MDRETKSSNLSSLLFSNSSVSTTSPKKVWFVQKSQTVLLNRSNIHDGMAIMDSGCERECAGKDWTEKFVNNLSPEDKKKVVRSQDVQQFRFGDGKCVQATYTVVEISSLYFVELLLHYKIQ